MSCATEDGRYILDPILHFNSYGTMNCGIISSLNIACWRQLGYPARYIQLGDHTVSEVSWDDGATWHLVDSSMSIYCHNHEGRVAGCEQSDKALLRALQTWHKADTNVAVTLDPARLGFRPAARAWDMERGQQVPTMGATLQLTLPGPYGTWVVTLRAKQ
jgi:hypothetical protein